MASLSKSFSTSTSDLSIRILSGREQDEARGKNITAQLDLEAVHSVSAVTSIVTGQDLAPKSS